MRPSFYSFKTKTSNLAYPSSWTVEGSNNNVKFKKVAEENDVEELKGNGIEKIFKFHSLESFHYFKFTQIKGSVSSISTNHFCMRSVELFGEIVRTNLDTNKNCEKKFNIHNVFICLKF